MRLLAVSMHLRKNTKASLNQSGDSGKTGAFPRMTSTVTLSVSLAGWNAKSTMAVARDGTVLYSDLPLIRGRTIPPSDKPELETR